MSNYPDGSPDLMSELADDGFSDFSSDYSPTDEQIAEWLNDDTYHAIDCIRLYKKGLLEAVWCDENQDIIEKEWENR